MRFTVPIGRHRPSVRELARGVLNGFYGLSCRRLLRRRVVFHQPDDAGFSGKIFGRSRGIGLPLRRLRHGGGELLRIAHEESDRFSVNFERWAIVVNVYAYRRGLRPWVDEALPGQVMTLAVLEFGRPYILTLVFERTRTKYAVYDERTCDMLAEIWIEHDPTPLWWLGKLAGLYVGGKEPAEVPVSVDVERP